MPDLAAELVHARSPTDLLQRLVRQVSDQPIPQERFLLLNQVAQRLLLAGVADQKDLDLQVARQALFVEVDNQLAERHISMLDSRVMSVRLFFWRARMVLGRCMQQEIGQGPARSQR